LQLALGGAEAACPCDVSKTNFFKPELTGANVSHTSVCEAVDATVFSNDKTSLVYCKRPLSSRLLADLQHLTVFGVKNKQKNLGRATKFWMGGKGVVTPLHYDNCHSVIVQCVGRKRVLTIPHEDGHLVYPKSLNTGLDTSWVDLGGWLQGSVDERERFPDVQHARISECVLLPGDTLYIPPCVWHYTEALEGNISVLQPFDMIVAEQRALSRPWLNPGWGFDIRPEIRRSGRNKDETDQRGSAAVHTTPSTSFNEEDGLIEAEEHTHINDDHDDDHERSYCRSCTANTYCRIS
jgi:hypothetical protein